MSTAESWQQVNRELVAKSIGELTYEQALAPVAESKVPGLWQPYLLSLGEGGKPQYRFRAWRTVWGSLRVQAETLQRREMTEWTPVQDAGQFFVDVRGALGMSELTLGVFLEEMHSTLASDLQLLDRHGDRSAWELSGWEGERVQCALSGHPKLLLNKGRLGWGAPELAAYAPENEPEIPIRWLAVRRERALIGGGARLADLVPARVRDRLPAGYAALPVHPWQWERVIQLQYAGLLASGELVDLGEGAERYRPQISLRTLSLAGAPTAPDLKLSLSILNTSAVRGIPPRYIKHAPEVATELRRLCESDPVLRDRGTEVLADLAGVSVPHPLYVGLPEAPYRYRETLGAIWRESVSSRLAIAKDPARWKGILTGALFHQDAHGASLAGAYIRRSGLSTADWLRRYFDSVVIPLYHLQLRHGIGLVAHGQNVVLKLRDHVPHGVILKDFQGDLRVSEPRARADDLLSRSLDALPEDHLIHDLITGHLVTVLRFVSGVLAESEGFSETDFYRLLAERVRAYLAEHAREGVAPGRDLLMPEFARVVLNPVRFRAGYGDTSERPRPLLGTPVPNPLLGGAPHA